MQHPGLHGTKVGGALQSRAVCPGTQGMRRSPGCQPSPGTQPALHLGREEADRGACGCPVAGGDATSRVSGSQVHKAEARAGEQLCWQRCPRDSASSGERLTAGKASLEHRGQVTAAKRTAPQWDPLAQQAAAGGTGPVPLRIQPGGGAGPAFPSLQARLLNLPFSLHQQAPGTPHPSPALPPHTHTQLRCTPAPAIPAWSPAQTLLLLLNPNAQPTPLLLSQPWSPHPTALPLSPRWATQVSCGPYSLQARA